MGPAANRSDFAGRLHIRLLGGFELLQNGLPLSRTRSRTEKWLLALLVLCANQEVNRSWLAGTFWPDARPDQALNNLRRSLSNLRQVLGEEAYRLLSPTTATITFDLAGAFCDVAAFDAAIAQGEAHKEAHKEAQRDVAALRQAVALYRGPLLPDCEADWLLGERESREQACLTALETLAHQALQNGDAQEAVERLRHALRLDPYRENLQCALMEALASQGDRAGMTLSYRQFRLLLHEGLQSEPSVETKALYLRLREEKGQTKQQAPLRLTEDTSRLHIPRPISALVGRKEESEEVAALLSNTRLVTLTGTGGIGKTRLALDVAAKFVPHFRDGVWFVDLAPVAEETAVVNAIAATLEVREEAGQTRLESLRGFLAGKELLLLLDNCEHLLNTCAMLTTTLLHVAPALRILATSRQALGVSGERAWRVPSLFVPEPSLGKGKEAPEALLTWPATRLFLERAQEASASFTLTRHNAPFVADICRRLDGIALAIELAAARVNVLSAEQIAVRLEDAFRLLTRGDRAALPRQQTLWGLLDWSYALLTPLEQRLLRVLSVFAGGWTLEAVEAVAADPQYDPGDPALSSAPLASASIASFHVPDDVLDVLASLIDKSLVIMQEAETGTVRYRLLETIRQYARYRLRESGETGSAQARHREWCAEFTEVAWPHLRGGDAVVWLNRIEAEHDNLRLALGTADDQTSLRIAATMWWFWYVRGYWSEGRERLSKVLRADESAMGRTKEHARVLWGAGVLAECEGDFERASTLCEESLAVFQEIEDRQGEAAVMSSLGIVAKRRGDFGAARDLLERSVRISQEIGDRKGMVTKLINLGNLTRDQGDYGAAREFYDESLQICREAGDRWGMASGLNNLGGVARSQGDYDAALALYQESLTLCREVGDRNRIGGVLSNLGIVAQHRGDYAAAQSLLEESLQMCRETGDRHNQGVVLNDLGTLARQRGDYAAARSRFEENLQIWQEIKYSYGIADTLERLATLCVLEGKAETAAQLWGTAETLREMLGAPLAPAERADHDKQVTQARSAMPENAFTEAWAEGRAMTMEQAIAYALGKPA